MCALAMVMQLDAQGLLWLAIVCSSWVWMSRGSTGRSIDYPLGVPCQSVDAANKMVARCGMLMIIAIARGAAWALEQPMSSLMVKHPTLVQEVETTNQKEKTIDKHPLDNI